MDSRRRILQNAEEKSPNRGRSISRSRRSRRRSNSTVEEFEAKKQNIIKILNELITKLNSLDKTDTDIGEIEGYSDAIILVNKSNILINKPNLLELEFYSNDLGRNLYIDEYTA